MRKRLCALVAGLLFLSQVARAEEFPLTKDYTTKKSFEVIQYFGEQLFHNTLYDVNDDGSFNVSELRVVVGKISVNGLVNYFVWNGKPLFYSFDINNNGNLNNIGVYNNDMDLSETLVDFKEDGFNGNETRASDLVTGVKRLL
ncbi:hypothetical protein GOV04_00320 [Candidatus Woesearchaeota archaeon]|nr:hypothetical protein [Candidatus Woesearchaeota archaeon]